MMLTSTESTAKPLSDPPRRGEERRVEHGVRSLWLMEYVQSAGRGAWPHFHQDQQAQMKWTAGEVV